MHLNEDDLVLHYYGELDQAAESAATAHLAGCRTCRASYTTLQRVLAAVEGAPEPALPDSFERTVWARLEPNLPARRGGWMAWFQLTPARLALAAAVILLVAGAYMAGRVTERQAAPALAAGDLRERILLIDLGEHLDRSQNMLVELVMASGADGFDMTLERELAEDLVNANRLYRQTAAATGDTSITALLDDLERLLVELAAGPDQLSEQEMDAVRGRIEADGLLFKVRVLASAIRERQQQHQQERQDDRQQRMRAGQSS